MQMLSKMLGTTSVLESQVFFAFWNIYRLSVEHSSSENSISELFEHFCMTFNMISDFQIRECSTHNEVCLKIHFQISPN